MDNATLIRYLADVSTYNDDGCCALLLALLFSHELAEESKQKALLEISEKITGGLQTNPKTLAELNELYIELGGNNG